MYNLKDFRKYYLFDAMQEATYDFEKIFHIPPACDEEYDKMKDSSKYPIQGERWDYYEKVLDVKERIEKNIMFTSDEFNNLISYYDLTFKFNIIRRKDTEDEYPEWTPLKFGFCEFDEAFEREADKIPQIEYYYEYFCYSMADVPFAILHYLLSNSYKFRRCEHCGKYFATKTFKQKYCTRNSPLILQKPLKCGEAVDHKIKTIKKRIRYTKNYLKIYYEKALWLYLKEVDEYLEGKEKNIDMLKRLEHITSEEYVKSNFYKEKYK